MCDHRKFSGQGNDRASIRMEKSRRPSGLRAAIASVSLRLQTGLRQQPLQSLSIECLVYLDGLVDVKSDLASKSAERSQKMKRWQSFSEINFGFSPTKRGGKVFRGAQRRQTTRHTYQTEKHGNAGKSQPPPSLAVNLTPAPPKPGFQLVLPEFHFRHQQTKPDRNSVCKIIFCNRVASMESRLRVVKAYCVIQTRFAEPLP